MPSAFTPNGDGHNDLLRPHLFGRVARFHWVVYNRWGGEVFETSDPTAGWDGTLPSGDKATGTFVWACEYQFTGDPPQSEKGTVMVIR
jgi:gliding motility-associated-like protein